MPLVLEEDATELVVSEYQRLAKEVLWPHPAVDPTLLVRVQKASAVHPTGHRGIAKQQKIIPKAAVRV